MTPFGSAEALAFFVEETVNGRGFGKEIGQGSAPDRQVRPPGPVHEQQGSGVPAYDGRAIQGIVWRMPRPTAVAATSAATPLRRK